MKKEYNGYRVPMKTKLLQSVFLYILIYIGGCQIKYVELKSIDELRNLDPEQVDQISIMSTSCGMYRSDPDKWTGKYRFVFPIDDSEKITSIMTYLREYQPTDYSSNHFTMGMVMCFKVGNTINWLDIGLESEKLFGRYWESKMLRRYLKELGLHEPKGADPNSPIDRTDRAL